MPIDLVIPEVAESIHEVQLLAWKKQVGDEVAADEEVLEIETEKATVPISAPAAGKLVSIAKKDGEFAQVGDVVGQIEPAQKPAAGDGSGRPSARAADDAAQAKREAAAMPPPLPTNGGAAKKQAAKGKEPGPQSAGKQKARLESSSEGTVAGGRRAGVTPEPPERPVPPKAPEEERKPAQIATRTAIAPAPAKPKAAQEAASGELERAQRRVRMNLLRQTIARRLVEAHQTAALVTTFNEVDMSEVIELRRQFGETFLADYEIKLGLMSFFVKAAVDALKRYPEVNARIEETDIVYHDYFDIGVAIGSGRGLVVPVLRNCERLSFADIERQIADLAKRATDGRLSPDELQGGTFTISNGGIYGSLLSTPIINPPQSGVLGLHAIQERPVARDKQVVIRPMMYVALTYDHRLVDGREAVGFLRRMKEVLETPSRLFLEV